VLIPFQLVIVDHLISVAEILMLLVKYSRSTNIGNVSICIVPAKFHEPRIDRFTMSEVNSVVNQRRKFEGADFRSSFTLNSMIAMIFVMSAVAMVKKERFN
jgi:hypothetical protein